MIATAFIRDCIVDKDKTSMIHGAIAAGTSQYGMQTLRPVDLQLCISRGSSRSKRRCAGRPTSTSSS